jgi:septal ring factor EnvC (AmiA/AmiB activator)
MSQRQLSLQENVPPRTGHRVSPVRRGEEVDSDSSSSGKSITEVLSKANDGVKRLRKGTSKVEKNLAKISEFVEHLDRRLAEQGKKMEEQNKRIDDMLRMHQALVSYPHGNNKVVYKVVTALSGLWK